MELDTGYYGSPRWSYEVLDCAMPMTFDTYSNCAHQCIYCFSFFQRAIGESAEDYLRHKVRAVDVDKVIRMFTNPNKYGGQFKNYIKRRMVLQWGGLSDGFDWYEKKFRKSLELLTFFNEIDYPVSISTKGVWFLEDEDYRKQIIGRKNQHWKYSIISDIPEHVAKIEPGTPTAEARFNALRELNNMGVGATTLRFRPFIVGTSDLCMESMMKKGAEAGCYSVTTEFLCWESRASQTSKERLQALSKVVGYDVMSFYREESAHSAGLLRLNYDYKRPYMKEMKRLAEKYGLKFFVSDAHHKEESYHAGCCGLPENGPLSNVNRGQFAHAIKLAKENGFVRWSDISDEAKKLLDDIPVVRAFGMQIARSNMRDTVNNQYKSIYDFMRDAWNSPNSWLSPARYFGGALVPSQPDENGDIIYLYNKPFIELEVKPNSVNELAQFLRMEGKPNAERFNEMTADGTDFGHVAYPIYVFSRKRWNDTTTIPLLDSARLNYHLIINREDLEHYQDAFPSADIIVLPNSAKDSIRKARQIVYELAKEEGYPYAWMLDDDIVEVTSEGKSVSLRAVFSYLEQFLEDYSNVAMMGIGNGSGGFDVNVPITGAYLLNLTTGIPFKFNKLELYENQAYALKHLKTGFWTTVSHNKFAIRYTEIASGGAVHILQKELRDHPNFQILSNTYHEVVLDSSAFSISWNGFNNPIISRNVEKLIEGE